MQHASARFASERGHSACELCDEGQYQDMLGATGLAAGKMAKGYGEQSFSDQDTFDHDKGKESAISGSFSAEFFEFSPGEFFPFLQVLCVN